jgi:hypothetical protein
VRWLTLVVAPLLIFRGEINLSPENVQLPGRVSGCEVLMDRSLARSNIYRMLLMLFLYPDGSARSLAMDSRWQAVFRDSLWVLDDRYFADCFDDFINECGEGRMASLPEMAKEHERLFSDSFPEISEDSNYMREVMSGLPDKMHESLMKSGKREGYGTGRTVSGATGNKAELNAHKFEVMAILAEMESTAVCGERIRLEEVQLDFLSRFIVPSVSVICEEVIKNSVLDFYRTLALLAREFVKFEENYLGIPDEPDTS